MPPPCTRPPTPTLRHVPAGTSHRPPSEASRRPAFVAPPPTVTVPSADTRTRASRERSITKPGRRREAGVAVTAATHRDGQSGVPTPVEAARHVGGVSDPDDQPGHRVRVPPVLRQPSARESWCAGEEDLATDAPPKGVDGRGFESQPIVARRAPRQADARRSERAGHEEGAAIQRRHVSDASFARATATRPRAGVESRSASGDGCRVARACGLVAERVVLEPPLGERLEQFDELEAVGARGVADRHGRGRAHVSLDEPLGLELAQAGGEQAVGDAGDRGAVLREPARPAHAGEEDGRVPLAPGELDRRLRTGGRPPRRCARVPRVVRGRVSPCRRSFTYSR